MCQWTDGGVKRLFEQQAAKPWTLGYQSVQASELECDSLEVTGRFPVELQGTFFRNGPARHELGDMRYAHRWDGDGMIQSFAMSDGAVNHRARLVATKKCVTETEAGRFLVSGFGSSMPSNGALGLDIDEMNAANIGVMMVAGELLALWEPGSAYALDPLTLETRGVKEWTGRGLLRPFSAHPKVEPDGTIWNFGADPLSGALSLYCIDADGRVRATHTMRVANLPPVHDFLVTEHHLVFPLPPVVFDLALAREGAAFGQSIAWRPELATRVLVISKADWSQRWYELPPAAMYHTGNAWEDASGEIRFDFMSAPDPRGAMNGWSIMQGEYQHIPGPFLTTAVLPVAGPATQSINFRLQSEFPSVRSQDVGQRHSELLCLGRSALVAAEDPGWDSVVLASGEGEEMQRYCYGKHWMAEEHVYAGSNSAGEHAWVVGTALDLAHGHTVLSVFDSRAVADGPIAQAHLPYAMPLGLHGFFDAAS